MEQVLTALRSTYQFIKEKFETAFLKFEKIDKGVIDLHNEVIDLHEQVRNEFEAIHYSLAMLETAVSAFVGKEAWDKALSRNMDKTLEEGKDDKEKTSPAK